MKRTIPASLLASCLFAFAPVAASAATDVASADDETRPAFGRRGQIVIEPSSALRLYRLATKDIDDDTAAIDVALGARLFVTDRLAVGLHAAFSRSQSTAVLQGSDPGTSRITNSNVQGGASVAWNRPVSRWASWFPSVGVGYGRPTTEASGTLFADGRDDGHDFVMSVNAPLLAHPARHVFVGVGPSLIATHNRRVRTNVTTLTLQPVGFSFGGWF